VRHAEDVAARLPFQGFEYAYRRADGGRGWLRINGKPVFDADGSFRGYRGTGTNVTPLKLQQESLWAAKDAAEEASRSKSEFLASMSHELRTPLNAILGFSEMMKVQVLGPLGERYREYAEDIHCSGRHLLDLINDLLDTARIEAGRLDFVEEPVALGEVLDEAIRLTRLASGGLGHALDLALPARMPRLRGDRRALKQVLINVLGNAAKFTPRGGRIAVRVAVADRIEGRAGEPGIEIVVSDTGIGIPAHRIDELGQPFCRVESVMSRRHQGSGMGLFITRSLVERHGGTLGIASREGEGTTVRIALPAARVVTGCLKADPSTPPYSD
jgi:signal transduction histidine kinase